MDFCHVLAGGVPGPAGRVSAMHFVGVDLAWGERRPTGVAVLDEDGTLVHLSSRTTDETVLAALTSYADGPCLVAFDAPLVVANDTGSRPAEAALNHDFGRFDAGAHPANRGRPEFAGTPRAARLAEALGLDIDPSSTAPRRAIEVYPHPATVVLFGLGRTLKYKQRSGRPLTLLRDELLRLMRLLEGLGTADPALRVSDHEGWRDLVAAVEAATSKARLRLVEDQVDAVLCAHVARFAHLHPDRTTTYGDLATGYIVTPTLPPGQLPRPRRSPGGAALVVQRAVQEYADHYPETTAATDDFVGLVRTLLDDAGINYLTVTGRTKSVASFAEKANRARDGRALYPDPLEQITDQIGVRVITYVLDDVSAVAELLFDQLSVLDDRDLARETAQQGRFGYASRHLLVALGRNGLAEEHPGLQGRRASVQVRTVLQHAWAEFEHDIRYKGTVPEEHGPDLDRRFTLAAGLLELADREFATIRERLRAGPGAASHDDPTDPRISAQDLAAFLSAQYADSGWSRTEHYAWISGLLLELGITSLAELGGLLTSVDSGAISERMGYRYPPGAVRRLDDALLAVFGERYLDLHGNAGRERALRTRLARLRGETPPGDGDG